MTDLLNHAADAILHCLLAASVIAGVLTVLAWVVVRLGRPRAAVHRHMLWFYCLVGIVALPPLWLYGPKLTLAVLPARAEQVELVAPATDLTLAQEPMPAPATYRLPAQPLSEVPAPVAVAEATPRLFPWRLLLCGLWLLGVSFMLARLAFGWYLVRRICRLSEPMVKRTLLEGVRARQARVLVSTEIDSPVAFGVLRPTIILPRGLYEKSSKEELLMVLRHELAHVARRDYLANAFQRLVEAAYFFHPLVWYASHRLTQEREQVCDNWVLTGEAAARQYAELLAHLAESGYCVRRPLQGVALFEGGLLERIRTLLDPRNIRVARPSRVLSIAAAVLGIGALAIFGTVQLVEGKTSAAAETGAVEQKQVRSETAQPVSDIFTAAQEGDVETVRALLARGADITRVDELGLTALHLAAQKGHREVAELLLDHGADVNAADTESETPLRKAVMSGHLDVAQVLLERGAEKDIFTAVGLGDMRFVRPLLRKDPGLARAADARLRSVLHWAAARGQKGMAELLLAHGADVNARHTWGGTPLIWAASEGHPDVVELLLVKGADPNVSNFDRRSPLTQAAAHGHREVVELLLAQGVDINAPNRAGHTPLFLARQGGHQEVAELLLRHDAMETTRRLELQVVHAESKEPLPGVSLAIGTTRIQVSATTDQHGRRTIQVPTKGLTYTYLTATKEGFVPRRVTWRWEGEDVNLPTDYTLALQPGTSVGGIIQDEEGNPIGGVTMYFSVPSTGDKERVHISDHIIRTDSEGRWRCDIVPADLQSVRFRLVHPDYVSDHYYHRREGPPIGKLREMTAVTVMEKGFPVVGTVTDQEGRPVRSAIIANGLGGWGRHDFTVRTDANGRFHFGNVTAGETILTARPPGYAVDLKRINVGPDLEPLQWRLEPGQTVRGRVIDSEGKPVPAVNIAATNWRGERANWWRDFTDADGRFEWNSAPSDEVLFSLYKEGYRRLSDHALAPSDEEHVVALRLPLKVRGTVTDAETGEPIPEFRAMPGIQWDGAQPVHWRRGSARRFTEGRYELTFTQTYPAHLVRVEADGHVPGISRPFTDDEGEGTFDFKLEKGTGPSGIVRSPDGALLSGAQVILATPSQGPYIRNGRLDSPRDDVLVETGRDGQFSLPPQTDPYAIVVLHDSGYAKVTEEELAASPEIKLQPWGRVEGKLRIGARPGANEFVALWPQRPYVRDAPQIHYDYRGATDSEGRFLFERVPGGEVSVGREMQISETMRAYSHSVRIAVTPGETARVTIGGTGRPVVGRVVLPPDADRQIDLTHGHSGLNTKREEVPYPWFGQETEAPRSVSTHYAVIVNPDGSFRVEDVAAGIYQLTIRVHEPPTGRFGGPGGMIGAVSYEFDVPEMPGGRSDEPLDIGELELQLTN